MFRFALRSTLAASALLLSGCATVRPAEPAPLTYDVFVSDEPGFHATSTLLMGPTEAILVDAQFTVSNGRKLAEWVASHGKTLKAIYVTHAHPDHFFGAQAVLERFPGTPVYATPQVVHHAHQEAPRAVAQWTPMYGAEIPSQPVLPTPLADKQLTLEGHTLEVLEFEQADMEHVAAVHVPSLGLVVGGDLTYSGVHVWLAETPAPAQRQQWLASLERLESLRPRAVVAGHKQPTRAVDASPIADTRAYIQAFEASVASRPSAEQLTSFMNQRFSDYSLPIILSLSVQSALGQADAK